MQQHMIPQDVTGYKFNLFGILNVSQFLQLIIPCGTAFLIWKVGVPLIIAVPIMIVLVLYGLLAAFVPINDRPVSHWVGTFFKMMYAPTKFYWRRQSFIPDFFIFNPTQKLNTAEVMINQNPAETLLQRRTQTTDFLRSVERIDMDDPLELSLNSSVSDLLKNYDQVPVNTDVVITKQVVKPNLSEGQVLRARQMQTPQTIFGEK